DHVGMDGGLGAVQVLDERDDPALEEEFVTAPLPLVGNRDSQALVQECELTEPLRENFEAEVDCLEDLRIWLERDFGASHLRLADFLQCRLGRSSPVALEEDLLLASDLDLEKLRQSVDDRHANPVKPARHFVRAFVEFAPGMKLGEHHFGRGDAFRRMNLGRDTTAVVFDRHAAFDMDRHDDAIAEASKSLVHRVIDNFEYEMMETPFSGISDVHSWPF